MILYLRKAVIGLLLSGSLAWGNITCPICGMEVKAESRTQFEVNLSQEKKHFCSLSCVETYAKRHSSEPVFLFDYETGEKIAAESAYFLARSEKLMKEIEFQMPPTVVGFKKKETAEKHQKRLGDGKIVQGLESLKKEFK